MECLPADTPQLWTTELVHLLVPVLSYAVLPYLAQMLRLKNIYDTGILHCDLRPENVLLTPSGHVAIGDFSLPVSTTETRGPFRTGNTWVYHPCRRNERNGRRTCCLQWPSYRSWSLPTSQFVCLLDVACQFQSVELNPDQMMVVRPSLEGGTVTWCR